MQKLTAITVTLIMLLAASCGGGTGDNRGKEEGKPGMYLIRVTPEQGTTSGMMSR
ncbi:MAG: hypothetical protein U5L72_10575 [Bacteroidales bacterium]|nr:hypothetical protein [Bacteroidales bacterium]